MTEKEFRKPLKLGGRDFLPGDVGTVHIPVGHGITHELLDLTIHVHRGRRPGPRLLITSVIHGDEINGVEVARRLLSRKMRNLKGDLLLIPVVNLPAFLARSRYLPDRRDLNRLFPGSATGSFGARLARILTRDVAATCTHCIDLHTGAVNRPNLPQIRYSESVPGCREMADAFGAPVMIQSDVRPGSFREVFTKKDKPMLMFEGGEAGNIEPAPVRLAFSGTLSVMRHLGMLRPLKTKTRASKSVLCHESCWIRAPRGGIFLPSVELGVIVNKGKVLGEIGDPFGTETTPIPSEYDGVIIGRARNAVIDEGDGVFHIGLTEEIDTVANNIEAAEYELDHPLGQSVFDDLEG